MKQSPRGEQPQITLLRSARHRRRKPPATTTWPHITRIWPWRRCTYNRICQRSVPR